MRSFIKEIFALLFAAIFVLGLATLGMVISG